MRYIGLQPGPSTDSMMAEAYMRMGFRVVDSDNVLALATNGDIQGCYIQNPSGGFHKFRPSTDIAAAFELLEKAFSEGWMLNGLRKLDRLEYGFWVCDLEKRGFQNACAHATTAPMAICLAILETLAATEVMP